MPQTTDTICALATPYGVSGVAIIRISGAKTLDVLNILGHSAPTPRRASLVTLRHPDDASILDSCLVIYFPAPHSFTGEDVAELHIHGSVALIHSMLDVLCAQEGVRLAEAGEFSQRAFQNQKMDLAQIEGLADVIAAQTSAQHKQATRIMRGELTALYEAWRKQLIAICAELEAYIDFPDEDLPDSLLDNINTKLMALIEEVSGHLNNPAGKRLREGLACVLLGAPNAGKSSLLNALAKRDVAIVSDIAGTTRDMIEVPLEIAGIPVTFCDTAGLRNSEGSIEQEGIRRAYQKSADADMRCVVLDSTEHIPHDVVALIDEETIVLANKADAGVLDATALSITPKAFIAVSAKTGQGLDALLNLLKEELAGIAQSDAMPAMVRDRHVHILRDCAKDCTAAQASLKDGAPMELTAEILRRGAEQLGRISGRIDVEDLLDAIFSQFCIGK